MSKKKSKPEQLIGDYRHHIASAQRHMKRAMEVRREAMVFVQEHGGEGDWQELLDTLNAIIAEFRSNPTGQEQYLH